jgi:phospholipase C
LPVPNVAGVKNPPFAAVLGIPGGNPGLPAAFQSLYNTGGTGLSYTLGPDTRIANVTGLPPGPFQMTGSTMPYDAYTADTIHSR